MLPFLPMHSLLHVSSSYASSLPFSLYSLLIQPLWLWSILIGCSTHLMFSKKWPSGMALMPVYIDTAEGLLKPLCYPPCCCYAFNFFYHYLLTTSSSPLSLLIHSFPWPTLTPISPYKSLPCSLSPLFLIVSPYLTWFRNLFYSWQNNVVRDSSEPLSP